MSGASPHGCRRVTAVLAAVALAMTAAGGPRADGPDASVRVRLELADGGEAAGTLASITADAIVLDTAEGPRSLRVSDVRRLVRDEPPRPEGSRLRVEMVDATHVLGDDFVWDGNSATVLRGAARIDLPIARVRRVEFGAADRPAWLGALPESPADDLVVVARDDGHEIVECAITAVAPDTITVILDGETIPVRRAKVRGLVWSRPRSAANGARVTFVGGTLAAAALVTAGDLLVIDDGVRLPVALLEAIDFAAGRSVALCDLRPDRVTTEPFVGELARVEGVASFFAMRSVAPPAPGAEVAVGERAIEVRPRTVATWQVPAASRRFHALVVRGAGARPQAAVRVAIRGDDRPAREVVVDATNPKGAAVEVDVAGAERLELVVDFVGDDPGCVVRLERASFER